MNIRSLQQGVTILLLALLYQPLIAADSMPEQLVRQTADEVLTILKTRQPEFKEQPAKLFELVDEKVLPHFDFERMTDLALGRYKRTVTTEQRPRLVMEFRQLLVRTYGKALLDYKDQVIAYLPMRGSIDKGEVTVRTEIEQQGGFPIPLNYELYRRDDSSWKVYDISVDNISLVTNYRTSFARKIKQDGIDGLINSLRSRNSEAS